MSYTNNEFGLNVASHGNVTGSQFSSNVGAHQSQWANNFNPDGTPKLGVTGESGTSSGQAIPVEGEGGKINWSEVLSGDSIAGYGSAFADIFGAIKGQERQPDTVIYQTPAPNPVSRKSGGMSTEMTVAFAGIGVLVLGVIMFFAFSKKGGSKAKATPK